MRATAKSFTSATMSWRSASPGGRMTSRPVAMTGSGSVVAWRIAALLARDGGAPRLEARPVAPVEEKPFDRHRNIERRRAHHARPAELEAAFLDDAAGARIARPVGAPEDEDLLVGEDVVDQRLARFGGEAAAPIGLADPAGGLGR